MLFLGIDPGKNGGLALIDEFGQPDSHCKMPDTPRDLFQFLLACCSHGDIRAAVEFVRSSPQMGVTSAFTFGRGLGVIEGTLSAMCVTYEDVRPQQWQSSLGCLSKGDKNKTKAMAAKLFPQIKITHWNADAFLIAEWLRRREIKGGAK